MDKETYSIEDIEDAIHNIDWNVARVFYPQAFTKKGIFWKLVYEYVRDELRNLEEMEQ